MKRMIAVGLVAAVVSGCATASTPSQRDVAVYPAKGQSAEQQSRDAGECTTWAKQQTGYDPGTETAKGAGVGAALGALGGAAVGAATGAITGHAGTGAAVGAVAGGVGGGIYGGAHQYSKSKEGFGRAYGACMAGRGYSVR